MFAHMVKSEYFCSPRENKGVIEMAKRDVDRFIYEHVDAHINTPATIVVVFEQLVNKDGSSEPGEGKESEWIPCKMEGTSGRDAKILPTQLNAIGIRWVLTYLREVE